MTQKKESDSQNSLSLVLSEIEKLSQTDFRKIQEYFRDDLTETNYKKILSNLELLVEGQEIDRQK